MMSISRELHLKICNSLIQLEIHVRATGDSKTADELREIIKSPDQFSSLQCLLSRRLRRRKRPDNLALQRHAFFSRFESSDGRSLSEKQVKRLVTATKRWELEDDCVMQLNTCALFWSYVPELFWNGIGEKNIIKRCVNDLFQMRTVDKSKRKVILITLSQSVEKERERIHVYGTKRVRDKKTKRANNEACNRESLLLTRSLNSLASNLWPSADDSQQKQLRKCFTDCSRYGWKWCQLENIEMTLSLYQIDSNSYETRGWRRIEFDALNAFIKTLPQFRIRERLEQAWGVITDHYRNRRESGPASKERIRTLYTQQPTVDPNDPTFPFCFPSIPITVVPSRRRKRSEESSRPMKKRRSTTSQRPHGSNANVPYSNTTSRPSIAQRTFDIQGQPVLGSTDNLQSPPATEFSVQPVSSAQSLVAATDFFDSSFGLQGQSGLGGRRDLQSPLATDLQPMSSAQSLVAATDFFQNPFDTQAQSLNRPGNLQPPLATGFCTQPILSTQSLVAATDFFDSSFDLQSQSALSRPGTLQSPLPDGFSAQLIPSAQSLVAATDFFDSSFNPQDQLSLSRTENPGLYPASDSSGQPIPSTQSLVTATDYFDNSLNYQVQGDISGLQHRIAADTSQNPYAQAPISAIGLGTAFCH